MTGQMEDFLILSKEDAQTHLHKLAFKNKVNEIKILIEFGANVNIKNVYGETPLMIASKWDNIESVKVLVEQGKANLNQVNNYDNTALHVAAFNNSIRSCIYLQDCKADIMKKNYSNQTALNIAEDREFRDCYDILEIYFKKELLWRNRNCLLKIYQNKDKTLFRNIPLNLFREIIKYA